MYSISNCSTCGITRSSSTPGRCKRRRMMAESRIIRAAAAQIAPDLHEASRTLARVLEAIDEAAEQGAEIIVFPETFVPLLPLLLVYYPGDQRGSRPSQAV
ncbi:TPA: nitrilase-related carbon-nitrogen hydrolase [Klebsiella pneumoniae]